jgi:hypothetical protein
MAMKKSRARIIRNKINLDLFPGRHNDYVFHDSCRHFPGDFR